MNAAGTTDGGYDAIPTAADPNGGLTKRTDSDEDQVVPPLQKRAGFSNANAAQIQTMKDLIAMWDLPGLPATGKQVSQSLHGAYAAVQFARNLHAAQMFGIDVQQLLSQLRIVHLAAWPMCVQYHVYIAALLAKAVTAFVLMVCIVMCISTITSSKFALSTDDVDLHASGRHPYGAGELAYLQA